MSLNLEQSSGLTAAFGSAVFSNLAAANTNVQTTTALTYTIAGLAYNVAAKASAASVATDFRTTFSPAAITGGFACAVVSGFDASGNLQFLQGPLVAYGLVNPVIGQAVISLPTIPAGFCPIAYQVIKNKNTQGTAAWTYGTSLFNAANVSFETAVQVTQLPNAGVTNTTA